MPIQRVGDMVAVILGLGDLRLYNVEDAETHAEVVAIAQGDSYGVPGRVPEGETTEDSFPPQIVIGSASREGLDALIDLLQQLRDRTPTLAEMQRQQAKREG